MKVFTFEEVERVDDRGDDSFLLNNLIFDRVWDPKDYDKQYLAGFINGWKFCTRTVKQYLIKNLDLHYVVSTKEYKLGFEHSESFSRRLTK